MADVTCGWDGLWLYSQFPLWLTGISLCMVSCTSASKFSCIRLFIHGILFHFAPLYFTISIYGHDLVTVWCFFRDNIHVWWVGWQSWPCWSLVLPYTIAAVEMHIKKCRVWGKKSAYALDWLDLRQEVAFCQQKTWWETWASNKIQQVNKYSAYQSIGLSKLDMHKVRLCQSKGSGCMGYVENLCWRMLICCYVQSWRLELGMPGKKECNSTFLYCRHCLWL